MSQKLENLKVNFSKESLGNMMEECQLPKEWKWVRLGEVIQEALPGFACGKRAGSEGFIQLRMNNISGNGQLNLSSVLRVPATKEQIERYRLIPRDVIFNNTNSAELVGKTTLFDEINGIFLYSNHLTRLRPVFKVLESSYLALWLQLQWYLRIFERICNRWIGQAAVQREKLLNLEIPLPCFSEQKRIAVKVKELMQEVERARTACEKQLEATRALSSAYLREVFESEEAKKWERKRLDEVLETIESGSRPKGGVLLIKEGVPSIGAEHLNSFGKFNFSYIRFIPIEFYQLMKRGKIQNRDVLVVKDGATTGKVSFVGDDFPYDCSTINEHVFRLRSKDSLDQEFLFWFLFSPLGQMQIKQEFHGAAQGGINQQFINSIYISIPSLSKQKQITAELKRKMEQVENLNRTIEKQLETINTLPQVILKKAFTGEL